MLLQTLLPAAAHCPRLHCQPLPAGGRVVGIGRADSSGGGGTKKKGSSGSGAAGAGKEEAAWARKHLPAGTLLYGRTGLTEAILHQSLDRVEPLLTV